MPRSEFVPVSGSGWVSNSAIEVSVPQPYLLHIRGMGYVRLNVLTMTPAPSLLPARCRDLRATSDMHPAALKIIHQ